MTITMTRLLTPKEVAEALKVDVSTVNRLARDGKLPGKKIGRQWRYPADVVEKLMERAA